MPLPPFQEWETFYVITGSSAAALTGLMFVVVALRTESRGEGGEGGVRAFGSPTIVHFCADLLLAGLLSVPGQGRLSLALCLAAVGAAGLALSRWVVVQARRQHDYAPVRSDWIWHVAMPATAYGALLVAAGLLGRHPGVALDITAAAVLLLLFVGIHNAWDSAVWIASRRR